MRYFLLCFIGLLAAHTLVRTQTPPAWKEKFQEAYLLLQGGDLAGATQRFEALWKSDPKEPELAYAIGTALDSSGHHRQATEWYQKALRLNPHFGPACNNLALNYASLGEFEQALPLLRKAIQLDPQNARASYNLGLIHLQLKHYAAAAQAFRRARELKPGERDPLARLAYASFLAGHREEGMQALDALLNLPGNPSESSLQAVQILNSAGLYREALARAQKARATGAGSEPLSLEEANSLFLLGDYKQAAEVLLKGEKSATLSVDYDLLLGSAQALAGDLPGAVKTLQTAVQIAPQRPEPYYRLALVFLEGYRNQDAQAVLTAGLERIPNSPLLLYALGTVNEVTGKYREAVVYLRKALEAKHDQPAVWAALGDLDMKLGLYEEALQAYQTARTQAPLLETAVKCADLLIRFKRYPEAEKLIRQALQQDRHLAKAYVSQGKLLVAQKNYAEAERALQRAIELDPSDSDAHLFLARVFRNLGQAEDAQRESTLAAEKRESERASTRLLRGVLVPVTENPVPLGVTNRARN